MRRARSWRPPAAPCPRSSARTARPRCSCRPATPTRSPPASAARSTTPSCAPASARPAASGSSSQWSWRHTAERTVEQYRALLESRASRPRPPDRGLSAPMLTVDFDRLGLRAGDRLLDLGCGRRPPRVRGLPPRRPGRRPRLRLRRAHGRRRHCSPPWRDAGDGTPDVVGRRGQRRRTAACRSPTTRFDRDHRLRGARAHPRRRRRARRADPGAASPAASIAVTVPAWLPEQVCWALSDEYHAPFVEGGHVRIYTEPTLRHRMRDAGLEPGGAHHAHALHSPYWWLKCAVGPTNDDNPLVKAYHRCSCGTSQGTRGITRCDRASSSTRSSARASSCTPASRRGIAARRRRRSLVRDVPSTLVLTRGDRCRARPTPRRDLPVDLHGVPTCRPCDAHRRRGSCPSRHGSRGIPGRPRRPVEPRRGGHGPGRRRPSCRGRAGLRVAGRHPAPRRRLAPVLPGRRRRAGQARRQRVRLRRRRRVAPLAALRGPRLRRDACGRSSSRPSTSCSTCRRPRGEILWARHADGTPWSFALLTGSSSICHSLRCAIALAELLGHERPDWELSAARLAHVIAHRARGVRPEAPLGDGLVLPGARRRAVGRRRPGAPGRPLRTRSSWRAGASAACRTARGSPSAETCECAHRPPGRRRDASAPRPCSAGPSSTATDGGRYWTGTVYPDEVHFPGDEQSTYTAAAVVLAADALGRPTRASALFADPESVLPPLVMDRLDAESDSVESSSDRD